MRKRFRIGYLHVPKTKSKYFNEYFFIVFNDLWNYYSNTFNFGYMDSEIIFESHGQLIGYKGILESLMPGSKIHASVVDIWVAIQNDLEKRRSTGSSSRVFVHSHIMVYSSVNLNILNIGRFVPHD